MRWRCARQNKQTFDPAGLRVTAQYANGAEKEVTQFVQFSQEPLTAEELVWPKKLV